MRSSRLLEMLLLLQSHEGLTAAEIAEKLGVSTRTIYRDVSALSSAGVPIYTERGRHGSIRLLPGYRTERVLVDPSAWMRRKEPVDVLGVVQCAVFADQRVRLRYRARDRPAATERIIDPYGLVCRSGSWYLVADHDGQPRLYRLSRAESAEALDEPVRRRPGVTLAALWEEARRGIEERPGRVLVKARVRRSALDLLGSLCASNLTGPLPKLDAADEEWAEVILRFPVAAAARILLSFGADVTVTEPEEVREDLAATATRSAAHHAGADSRLPRRKGRKGWRRILPWLA